MSFCDGVGLLECQLLIIDDYVLYLFELEDGVVIVADVLLTCMSLLR